MLVLLPCHSLEDLSLERPAEEAEQILGGWTALFHPALIAKYRRIPTWDRATYPMSERDQPLIVIPACCTGQTPETWLEKRLAEGAVVIDNATDRDMITARALEIAEATQHPFDPDFVEDLHAVGYGYLVIELLTRQLRYMSNLDAGQVESELVRAVDQYLQGNREAAEHRIRAALDALTQAREYFYPIETYVLDLTLTAPTLLNADLERELREQDTLNLILSGETLEAMVERRPDLLALLREAIVAERVVLLGGERRELPLPLLPMEPLLRHLRAGLAFYEEHTGARPEVFLRHTKGLTACLPRLLDGLGYAGAVHYSLDGGLYQQGNQSKVRWKGADDAVVDALIRFPIEPRDARVFLRMPETYGHTMDLDHVATLVFAHWPGHVSRWFESIRRASRYSNALGKLVDARYYFKTTQYAGQAKTHAADTYRSGWLTAAVARGDADPISRWQRYYTSHTLARHLAGLASLGQMIADRNEPLVAVSSLIDEAECFETHFPANTSEGDAIAIADRLRHATELTGASIAGCLPKDHGNTTQGILVLNPWSFPRREVIDVSMLSDLPKKGGSVLLAQESKDCKWVVGEIPPMGFAWFGPAPLRAEPSAPPRRSLASLLPWRRPKMDEEKPLAEDTRLRNEFFEVTLDPTTGALESLFAHATRGNRLAQQIALRFPESLRRSDPRSDDDGNFGYSIMAADRMVVESAGPVEGRLRTEGRLMGPDGAMLARFRQWHTVRRASRVLEIELELDVDQPPGEEPWDSYYAVRTAWADATVDCLRSVNSGVHPSEADLVEAPQLVDLRGGGSRLTLLSGGLPFHRRLGLRQLDTLLVVAGETARRFRIGIGIDLPNPMQAAISFLTGPLPRVEGVASPKLPSAWLEHVNAKNVLVSHREFHGDGNRLTGCRLRLLETDGIACEASVRLFRPVRSANKVDFLGQKKKSLTVEGDRVDVGLGAYELMEMDIAFA